MRAVALLILALAASATMPAFVRALDVGARAPRPAMRDLAGKSVGIPRGKVVLLDIWASWCGPCKEELPALDRLYRRYRKQGFRIVAVNIDRKLESATAFLDKHPVAFTVVHDPESKVPGSYGPKTMPSSYLIDHRGVIRHVHEGYRSGDDKKIAAQIEALLAKLPKAETGKEAATGKEAEAGAGAATETETETETATATATETATETATATATETETETGTGTGGGGAAQADGSNAPPPVQPSEAGRSGGLCTAAPGTSATAWPLASVLALGAVCWRRRRAPRVSAARLGV